MGGFKLIAITPLINCDPKFSKNLKTGEPYQFYNNYDIQIDKDSGRVIKVIPQTSALPENFYSLKNGIQLNISAVVGKNGSGKSTLFELFYYLVHQLVTQKQNLPSKIKTHSEDLIDKNELLIQDYLAIERVIGIKNRSDIKGLKLNSEELKALGFSNAAAYIYSLLKKHHLTTNINGSDNDVNSLLKIWSDIGYKIRQNNEFFIKEEKENEQNITKGLQLSVLYEINKVIYELEYVNGNFSYHAIDSTTFEKVFKSNLDDFTLSNFFYTVAINYSHHSLNSETIGNWIAQLFHKNDAYVTPVVINPMRDDGDIDINNEIALSTERVMTNILFNLLKNNNFKLLNKYSISKFIFEPKKNHRTALSIGFKLKPDSTLNTLLIEKANIDYIPTDIDYWQFAFAYLEEKLERINTNYPFLIQEFAEKQNPLAYFVMSDNSHITKKVKQALNFLKSTLIEKNREYWKYPEDDVRIEIPVAKYIEWLNTFNRPLDKLMPDELSEFALPGFMSVDFELKGDDGSIITFGKLSSGEQQMIFNVNTILYHLYNLQSVHKEKNRLKYEQVNLVLDEVELYYHPEMQRQLVKNIKDSLENIKEKDTEGIKDINVCFLTHSPFILSDIPKENVLRLPDDDKETVDLDKETFGANVYDLLADSFFMQHGFVGAYAMEIIDKVLYYINKNDYEETEHLKMAQLAELISDKIISGKLIELLNDVESKSAVKKSIDSQIEKLEAQKKKIDQKINNLKKPGNNS